MIKEKKEQHSAAVLVRTTATGSVFCALYGAFLFVIPQIVQLIIPCLRAIPGQSFMESDCTTVLALDTFIVIALSGLSVWVICIYSLYKNQLLVTLILSTTIALLTIGSYYAYAPHATSLVGHVPIILEGAPAATR